MGSLLNKNRPPAFCPGCSHERLTQALDTAFEALNLDGSRIAIVSDIGCAGLFDTFFDTHALHGLHGRALTYAAGLKLARPELNVIVIMGDGGLGIGGAHLLAACRRNLDLTLLILNNFNFGMTGGQFSATTPAEARVGSGFLNRLEHPLDVCRIASSAGAAYVARCSSYVKNLPQEIEKSIRFTGFAVLDIWGICPGRFAKQNELTPRIISESIAKLPSAKGPVPENSKKEYGRHYRKLAAKQKPALAPEKIEAVFKPPEPGRQEVIILGSAGQRIQTAGEILCIAGLHAGLNVTQKNDYNITVLRGPSVSEVILCSDEIDFTGIRRPGVVLALSQEGVDFRSYLFGHLGSDTTVVQTDGVEIPPCGAKIYQANFNAEKIKSRERALAALAVLAGLERIINFDMLSAALKFKFKDQTLASVLDLATRVTKEKTYEFQVIKRT